MAKTFKKGIKIINTDGLGRNTRIIRLDTGEDITDVLRINKIELTMDVDGSVQACLTIAMPLVESKIGEAQLMGFNPVTNDFEKISQIRFESGNYLDFDGLIKLDG